MIRRSARIAEVALPETIRTIVVAVPDGRPAVLEGSAEAVWSCVPAHETDGASIEAIAEAVAELAGVEAAAIVDDVRVFVAQLLAEGLLERVEH